MKKVYITSGLADYQSRYPSYTEICLISILSFVTDGDEPLMSGSGVVSKEITDENLLEAWRDVLKKWHQNLGQKPKQVHQLARKSIPEALRGEVWQLLAGCQNSQELLEAYRILMTKVRYCVILLFTVYFLERSAVAECLNLDSSLTGDTALCS